MAEKSESRPSSRRSSLSCLSNKGSVHSEGSVDSLVQQQQMLAQSLTSRESNTDSNEEDGEAITLPHRCSSCKEGHQIQQPLSVQQARQRSYLHGSVGLLGTAELKRILPDGLLRVFIGTWNMNGKTPPAMLEDLLLPTPLQSLPDVVVVGTQETNGDRDEWEISLQETLGTGHVLFHSVELGTLHLAVFLRRDLIWVCSVPESDSYSTRAGVAFRTKGGVAIGFSVFGTSFLFMNCHLTAHAEKAAERNRDFKKIFNSIDLPKDLPVRKKHRDVTNNYDVVFLCGDLNFRLDRPREEVIEIINDLQTAEHGQGVSILLESDQLKRSLAQNRLLTGFNEAPIHFVPTYKYIPGSDDFDDSAKQRVPSYTDRILWKERKGDQVRSIHYDAARQLKSSDHFPVTASFTMPIKPGRETMPLSAGTFNRPVYLEGMKRRARLRMVTEMGILQAQALDPNRSSANGTCTIQ